MSEPFKILAEEVAYKVPGRYAVMLADLETPEGKHTQWSYIHWEKDIVVVLPLTDDHHVYLKKEWRLNRKDFVWEVVSGFVEHINPTEEDIRAAADRETQEEVGMKVQHLEKLLTIYPHNHMRCKIHLFLATGLTARKLPGDEHEILEVQKLPFAEAYDLVVNQQEPTAQNALIFMLAKQRLGL